MFANSVYLMWLYWICRCRLRVRLGLRHSRSYNPSDRCESHNSRHSKDVYVYTNVFQKHDRITRDLELVSRRCDSSGEASFSVYWRVLLESALAIDFNDRR